MARLRTQSFPSPYRPGIRHRNPATALLLLVLLLLPACTPAADPRFTGRLHPCAAAEGPNGAYCGTFDVFEDRQSQAGRRISLNVVVLRAMGDDARPDPLFFLAGGPGQGAAELADVVRATFRNVQRYRDIVLVDQRGTGRSHPLDCPGDAGTLAEVFADENTALRRLQECLRGLDADVRLYTTSIAMDDLDDVRRHLGYERVNLYGGSYGTRAALVYLRRHGDHVRSVILDGAAPTGMRLPLYSARDAGRALDALLAACEADEICRTAYPDLAARIRHLIDRLARTPVRADLVHPRTGAAETVEIDGRAVASIIFGALYSPLTASMLPLLVERAERNDFQGIVALAMAGDQSEQVSLGMQLSVLCSEDAPFIDPGDVAQATAGSVFGTHLLDGQLRACERWPKGQVPQGYHDPVVSDVPALVLSGRLDPVTPPSWGEEVVRHLRHGRHIVAGAAGHGVAGTGCGARIIAAFIESADAATVDAACLESLERPPFFLTPTGPDPAPAPAAARR